MKLLVVLVTAVMLAAACSGPDPTLHPSLEATVLPSQIHSPAPSPTLSCDLLPPADCDAAARVALAAVRGLQGTPVAISLGAGIWWPRPGMMCNDSSCPAWQAPPAAGTRWVAWALIAFAWTLERASLNISRRGGTFSAVLLDLSTPQPYTFDPGPS